MRTKNFEMIAIRSLDIRLFTEVANKVVDALTLVLLLQQYGSSHNCCFCTRNIKKEVVSVEFFRDSLNQQILNIFNASNDALYGYLKPHFVILVSTESSINLRKE